MTYSLNLITGDRTGKIHAWIFFLALLQNTVTMHMNVGTALSVRLQSRFQAHRRSYFFKKVLWDCSHSSFFAIGRLMKIHTISSSIDKNHGLHQFVLAFSCESQLFLILFGLKPKWRTHFPVRIRMYATCAGTESSNQHNHAYVESCSQSSAGLITYYL